VSDERPFPEPPPLPGLEPPPLPHHPPQPVREAPPLAPPRARRSRWKRRLWLAALLLGALWIGPLKSEVRFLDDAGRVPVPFDVVLRGIGGEKKVRVEKGRLRLLRGRWHELVVDDPFFESSTYRLKGRRIHLGVERNLRLKLKQASTGSASIPQRGDPDPR
jgi:hypothetical protein